MEGNQLNWYEGKRNKYQYQTAIADVFYNKLLTTKLIPLHNQKQSTNGL